MKFPKADRKAEGLTAIGRQIAMAAITPTLCGQQQA